MPSRAVLLAMLVPLAGAGACSRLPAARGYDLLLVTLDTVRADRLGAYGSRSAETPSLDRLARQGLRFETAIAAAPLTLPSHATMLTGLLPPRHGLRNNGAGALPPGMETLAMRLSSAGYRTAAFVGAFVLDRRYGLDHGFEHYDDAIERDPNALTSRVAERPGSVVVERALSWIGAPDERPFFAWVHLYDAHAPYDPPEPFRSRHPASRYQGEIASVDAQVGRLLDLLEKTGRAGRTVVAVVADHGESLGEHGELTHGLLVYEPTLRVPFLLRAPGVVPAGRTVTEPVSLADLGPTLAGLLERPFASAAALNGRDLSRVLRQGGEPPAADVYSESHYPRTFGWSALAAMRRGNLKFISAPRPELYDLGRDPGEAHDRIRLDGRQAEMEKALVALGKADRKAAPAFDHDARERLASLGYVVAPPDRAPGDPGRDPKDVVGLFRRFEVANWAVQGGRLEEAIPALETLVAEEPTNAVFRGLLAEVLRRRGHRARAVRLYRQAAASAPDDPDVRYNLALTLHEAGRHQEAWTEAEEAVRLDPARPESQNALGIARLAAGRPGSALAAFTRACELDPRDPRAHNNRGNVLRQMGRAGEAEEAYRRAMELAPRYGDSLNGLGTLEVERGRPAAALPLFERALEAAPDLHEARLNRAIALETL
ncbi:MAG: sulfatase-like hydrolase/transferase, partial [Candidatus Rokubacteria bacterium]|nr:sulfatase-like hydrolase/transferase [Candidatus Rokubacteria bacterium]